MNMNTVSKGKLLLSKHPWTRLKPSLVASPFAEDIRRLAAGDSNADPPPPAVLEAISQETLGLSSPQLKHDKALLTVTRWVNDFLVSQTSNRPSSEAAYTKETLERYDSLVWNFNSPFHWRIHPEEVQALYNDCLLQSSRHAEVAVGTGKFLHGLDITDLFLEHITLLDLNPNTLSACMERLSHMGSNCQEKNVEIQAILCDILEKQLDPTLLSSFDSVAANFLVHCLHGGIETTRTCFQNIQSLLQPNGVFFGTTILGAELDDKAGPATLETNDLYNEMGIFGNQHDCFKDISQVLHECFDDVQVWRIGYCAAWIARNPKQSSP
jgi:hypothetical protein